MESNEFKIRILPLGQKLHRFAMSLLKDVHESEDIVQEIFLKLWNLRDQLREIGHIDAYAFRMTRNLCLDRLKAKKPDLVDPAEDSGIYEKGDGPPDPEQQMITRDALDEVGRLMEKLPEQQKTVLMMRDVEGYSYEEVARVLDMEVNAVRVTASRARKAIRSHISSVNQPWKI